MKPKPFEALNHFTVPCSLLTALPCSEFALAICVLGLPRRKWLDTHRGGWKRGSLHAGVCCHSSAWQSRNIAGMTGRRLDSVEAAHTFGFVGINIKHRIQLGNLEQV